MADHPFREAWNARDVASWRAALAPDAVLWSPIVSTPFRGREAVAELYEVLFARLGAMEIVEEVGAGDARVFYWAADVSGRRVEGFDLVRLDSQGLVSEIRVAIRPLADIAAFAAAVGPPLAERLPAGAIRALLARLLTAPLRPLLLIADRVGSLLTQRR